MPKLNLSWITERHKSGTVWRLYKGSFPTEISIFRSRDGYVINQDEYPTYLSLKKAKNESIKRIKI